MSAGRGTQGQLNTDISAAVGQSTWTERSPSTERQLTCYLQYADMRLPDQYKDTIQSSVVYSRVSSRIEWWRLLVSLSFYMGANLQLLVFSMHVHVHLYGIKVLLLHCVILGNEIINTYIVALMPISG